MPRKVTKNKSDLPAKTPEKIGPQLESTPLKYGKDEQGNRAVSVLSRPSDNNRLSADGIQKERLKEIMAVKDTEIAEMTLRMGSLSFENYSPDQKENVILQSISNLKPKDLLESRLITQETVLHSELMKALFNLSHCENAFDTEVRINIVVKLTRIHNETIETLSKYRRGGMQTVNVQHTVVDNRAVVNNFGVGDKTENRGDSPCPFENVVQKREPTVIGHVDSQQCLMGAVDFMAGEALALKRMQERKN